MKENPWARLLAYVTGVINQELLLKNEYLAAENRIWRAHLPARLRLSDPERSTLAEIGKHLGRKALAEVACVAKPDTILGWYRNLIAKKFDGSKHRRYPGRPPIEPKLTALADQLVNQQTYTIYDNASYIHGNHQFKFGVEFHYSRYDGLGAPGNFDGTLNFQGDLAFSANGGSTALQDFLAGKPASGSILVNPVSNSVGFNREGFYFERR